MPMNVYFGNLWFSFQKRKEKENVTSFPQKKKERSMTSLSQKEKKEVNKTRLNYHFNQIVLLLGLQHQQLWAFNNIPMSFDHGSTATV